MSGEDHAPTTLARMAAVLCASPVFGIALTVTGLIRAFHETAENAPPDPAILKQHVGPALFATAVGLVLSLAGFPLALWSIFAKRQRMWWLVMAAAFAGFMLLWAVLHGTWIYLHPPDSAQPPSAA